MNNIIEKIIVLFIVVLIAGGFYSSLSAQGQPVGGPAGGPPILVQTKTVFVTSQRFDGNLGGRTGADAECQVAANTAGLAGTYRAWISDSALSPVTDSTFTKDLNPYVRPDGAVVAREFNDFLDLTILATIEVDENGNRPGFSPIGDAMHLRTWTGIDANNIFTPTINCSNWSTVSSTGSAGLITKNDSLWTGIGLSSGISCSNQLHLYCFEQ